VSLTLQVRTSDRAAVIRCHGEMLAGSGADALKQTVASLFKTYRRVVVNLHELKRLDCAGVGAIAACASLAWSQHKSLALCCVAEPVRKLLELTHLTTILTLHESERCALAARCVCAA